MKPSLEHFINKILQDYSKRKGIELPKPFDYGLIVSKDPAHGDFASNLAFKLSGLVRQKPNLTADELVLMIESECQKKASQSLIERVEVAGGGFINFYLTKESLAHILFEVRKQDLHYGESRPPKKRKILLEFVSANPTGPLTIAHGRQAAVGDCLARILRTMGHEVVSEYYLNDAGRQMNLLGASLYERYKEAQGKDFSLPEEGYKGAYLADIAQKLVKAKKDTLLKEALPKALDDCRQFAAEEIMKGIRADLDAISAHFDHYFNESKLYEKKAVDQALNALTDRGHLYEHEGALWFCSTAFGDDKDRVVKKSTGEYTYLAPDIAYHRQKFERGFEWLINFWGPDHHGYIPRLKAACQAMGFDAKALEIRIVQLTTLYRKGEPVRMSTRAGEFVTLRELIDEVGAEAARFFFIMRRIESHLDFDLDLAKQKSQDNPIYYLQYAHARIASLLRYADRPVPEDVPVELLGEDEEKLLMKRISEFPEAVIRAGVALEPHGVTEYLKELAAAFHKFYSLHRVVTENEALTQARLLLADATRITLRNGLRMLGISQPESM